MSTSFSALPGVPPPPRTFVGATLIDGTGAAPVPDSVVLIRDGKIDCAGPRAACPVPAGVDTADVSNFHVWSIGIWSFSRTDEQWIPALF